MSRELMLGNGRLVVAFDADYTLRDVFYPHVGQENHTVGHPSRTGVWVEGRFAWLSDPGWRRRVSYRADTLVSRVTLEHPELELHLEVFDAVHPEDTILLRSFRVTNRARRTREIRIFFHHDFHIAGSEIGDTAYYDPTGGFLVHYKGHRYFLANGRSGDGQGIFQYATGTEELPGSEGTWRDAEDGFLEGNPIAEGSVDSVISLRQQVRSGDLATFHYWLAAERGLGEAKALDRMVLAGGRPLMDAILYETEAHWRSWVFRAPEFEEDTNLLDRVGEVYRRSLLVIGTHVDHDGAIIAANDHNGAGPTTDVGGHMWPRIGALVARTLDQAGYHEVAERFFRFCARAMPPATYAPEGYLPHRFRPDGSAGSASHPWIRDGRPALPIQEDATALVVWAFAAHFDRDEPDWTLLRELSPRLVVPAARFMLAYRDTPEGREAFHADWVHPPTNLPLPSYDVWEERYGIHTFTVAAVCAGLDACARLVARIAELGWTEDADWSRVAGLGNEHAFDAGLAQADLVRLGVACRRAAADMRAALAEHLWSEERGSYARMLAVQPNGGFTMDTTLDAATPYGLLTFGALPASDPKVRATARAVDERLWCRTEVGGTARYENDAYHRVSDDLANVPGTPSVVCTLWGASTRIALAETREELGRPRELIEWVCAHAQPSGALAEQVHPYTGAPMSVSPLTWSHAAFVETVRAYCERWATLR